MKRRSGFILLLLLAPLLLFASAQRPGTPAVLRYLSPPDGGQFVPPGSTVALRLDGLLDPLTISTGLFTATGSISGQHPGKAQLADDNKTLVFKPATPFKPAETVTVVIGPGLATRSGAVFGGLRFAFTISASQPKLSTAQELQANDEQLAPGSSALRPASPAAVAAHPQDYVTFPHDFPAFTVTIPASGTAPGLLFMAPFNNAGGRNFLFIADNSGEPVFWQAASFFAHDFKRQPDGSLTYFDNNSVFHVLDSTYSETKTIVAANGYTADFHDLQILPNGHALFLIYDPEITSTLQFGGYPTATVTGLVIQELDTGGLPVFQWTSWSHFDISDTNVSLTTTMVDYVHGNALELDNDGNILLSSRHLSEITKIDHSDGHIIWRLGGKNNQFAMDDPNGPFSCQHDIRRLANGNITIYDNHNPGPCSIVGTSSRAVEYQIDETAKLVTNTWQYSNNPAIFGFATGDNQRLPNGNRLIDWGITHPNVSEVLTDGTKSFEMTLSPTYFTYRAFRFPWAAVPHWAPTLVLTDSLALTPTLYYSWNGATDVASWEIYGGFGSQPQTLLGTQTRTGFEDHTALVAGPPNFCAFRVRPVDHEAQPQTFSNVVYTRTPCNGFADVALTKSVNTGAVQPGQALTYTLVFTNAGPDLAPNVSLTDIIPANLVALTYTSSGAALTPVGQIPYTWQVADLAPGAGGMVTVTGVLSGGLHGSVYTNTATISMVYSDTNPANNTSAVTVTVTNIAPVATDDFYTVVANTPFTVTAPGVLWNDSDANNDALTATLSASPMTGTLGLLADGSFTYTPPLGFLGTVTFTYQAGDGDLLSAPATVILVVDQPPFADAGASQVKIVAQPVTLDGSSSSDPDNNLPLAFGWMQTGGPAIVLSSATISRPTFTAPSTPAVLTFSLTVTDAYGLAGSPATTVVSITDQAITGLSAASSSPAVFGQATTFTASVTSGTNVSYTWGFGNGATASGANPNFSFNAVGLHSVVVTATNSTNQLTGTTTVTVDDIPLAADDNFNTPADMPLVVPAPGVLANDSDVFPGGLTAQLVIGPVTGTLVLAPSGAFTYTPPIGFTGPITFTYRANDGLFLSAPALVTITVNAYQLFWPMLQR